MADKIGFQDGIKAAEAGWEATDPRHANGYRKLAGTLAALKAGHNEYEDRLAALEARPVVPFPFAAPSSPGA